MTSKISFSEQGGPTRVRRDLCGEIMEFIIIEREREMERACEMTNNEPKDTEATKKNPIRPG